MAGIHNILAATRGGVAASVTPTAWFGGGFLADNVTTVATADTFLFATLARTTATSLPSTNAGSSVSSTSTTAYQFGGYSSLTTTRKYDYVGNSYTTGSALGTGRQLSGAAGNTSVAIVGAGTNSAQTVWYNTTEKYTYSGDTRTTGTNLAVATAFIFGTGTSTVGLFAGGNKTSATNLYTYANDTRTAGTNIPYNLNGTGGVSTATDAFVWYLSNTLRYNYSANTWTLMATQPDPQWFTQGTAANTTTAILAGGNGGYFTATNKVFTYSFSGNTYTTASSTLTNARGYVSGGSNVHSAIA